MPNPILIAIICISMLGIYIRMEAGLRSQLDRYTCWFLGYLSLDAAHTWLAHMYFADHILSAYFSPYGLLYGPFLYFAHQVAIGKQLTVRPVLLHALPFLVFLAGYFFWLVAPQLFVEFENLFGQSLAIAISLSLASYAIWALFFRSALVEENENEASRMLSAMAMLLAFIAVVMAVATFSRLDAANARSHLNGAVIFLTMLSASLILFSYIARRAVRGREGKEQVMDTTPDVQQIDIDRSDPTPEVRYQKSAIPADMLEAYEVLLRKLVEDKQAYLDDSLSLASLAQHLKIPKHHLSQVFSLRIGKNFNAYVNEHRINHAIKLMHAHPEMSITDIFFNSGFIAKASFNRYFKQFRGCTPTEYRNSIQV